MNTTLSKIEEWLREPGLRTEVLSNGDVLKWLRVEGTTIIVHLPAQERPWIFYVEVEPPFGPSLVVPPARRREIEDDAPLTHGPGTGCKCTACETWEA